MVPISALLALLALRVRAWQTPPTELEDSSLPRAAPAEQLGSGSGGMMPVIPDAICTNGPLARVDPKDLQSKSARASNPKWPAWLDVVTVALDWR